jgi:diaminopimelate epimerase
MFWLQYGLPLRTVPRDVHSTITCGSAAMTSVISIVTGASGSSSRKAAARKPSTILSGPVQVPDIGSSPG